MSTFTETGELTPAMLLLIAIYLVAGGSLIVFGAYRRWKWLVDPPPRLAWLGGHFLLRYLLGARVLRWLWLTIGGANVAIGMYGAISVLVGWMTD